MEKASQLSQPSRSPASSSRAQPSSGPVPLRARPLADTVAPPVSTDAHDSVVLLRPQITPVTSPVDGRINVIDSGRLRP